MPQLANLVTKCVRIAEFERPNDLPGWRLLTVENPNGKIGCAEWLCQEFRISTHKVSFGPCTGCPLWLSCCSQSAFSKFKSRL